PRARAGDQGSCARARLRGGRSRRRLDGAAQERKRRLCRRWERARLELTYGEYGGRFVPETLIPALDELEAGWHEAWADEAFRAELDELGRSYAGRPTPLTLAERFAPGKRLYLKREDLLHTGAHKLNN